MALVLVEATDPFVTILPDGMHSAVRGERVALPKHRADELIARGLAKLVESRRAPEDKSEGPAPEVKTAPKRAAKKAAPPA